MDFSKRHIRKLDCGGALVGGKKFDQYFSLNRRTSRQGKSFWFLNTPVRFKVGRDGGWAKRRRRGRKEGGGMLAGLPCKLYFPTANTGYPFK